MAHMSLWNLAWLASSANSCHSAIGTPSPRQWQTSCLPEFLGALPLPGTSCDSLPGCHLTWHRSSLFGGSLDQTFSCALTDASAQLSPNTPYGVLWISLHWPASCKRPGVSQGQDCVWLVPSSSWHGVGHWRAYCVDEVIEILCSIFIFILCIYLQIAQYSRGHTIFNHHIVVIKSWKGPFLSLLTLYPKPIRTEPDSNDLAAEGRQKKGRARETA